MLYLVIPIFTNHRIIAHNRTSHKKSSDDDYGGHSYHDLRHTCASLLLNKGKTNGVTLKDIQVWLGHSDFSTTANTYSHLDANSKFSSLNTLAGVVNL